MDNNCDKRLREREVRGNAEAVGAVSYAVIGYSAR